MIDLYFEINPKQNKIISSPKELQTNWKNISGITYLSKKELYDLSWAGYDNFGFVKICIDNYDTLKKLKYENSIFLVTKSKYKDIVSDNRRDQELRPLLVDNRFSVQLTDKFKLHLLMKYNECISDTNLKFNWKTISGPVEFTSEKFLIFHKKIQKYIQKLYDMEIELHKKIDSVENMKDLLKLDLRISCSEKIKL
jgi:hypothetical protein